MFQLLLFIELSSHNLPESRWEKPSRETSKTFKSEERDVLFGPVFLSGTIIIWQRVCDHPFPDLSMRRELGYSPRTKFYWHQQKQPHWSKDRKSSLTSSALTPNLTFLVSTLQQWTGLHQSITLSTVTHLILRDFATNWFWTVYQQITLLIIRQSRGALQAYTWCRLNR